MSADPARTPKGRKLAGQYGNAKATAKNLLVVYVNTEDELLLVRGSVPGPVNGLVRIELVADTPRAYSKVVEAEPAEEPAPEVSEGEAATETEAVEPEESEAEVSEPAEAAEAETEEPEENEEGEAVPTEIPGEEAAEDLEAAAEEESEEEKSEQSTDG
jgi:large subunit ribosomal protein L3